MRQNLPVTNREVTLNDEDFIVTITDPKGVITYVNESFTRISGYTRDELIGSPHNIVRHPDMPREAFDDLWKVIQRGFPWSGLVKNRCKNGDHYWVHAGVTPIMHEGRISGYVSVRTKPEQKAVDACERIYAEVRNGNPRRLAIRDGAVQRTGVFGLVHRFMAIPFHRRLWVTLGGIAALGLGAGWLHLLAPLTGVPWISTHASAIAAMLGSGVALSLIGVVFYMDRRIGLPLMRAVRVAQTVAAGDISARFDSHRGGELRRFMTALNQMNAKLTAVLIEVKGNVGSISDAVSQLAQGSIDLSNRTERQAESVRGTAQNTGDLTRSVNANVHSVHQASNLAASAKSVAHEGLDMASRAIGTMQEIDAASRKVAEITGVIDGIAFQTNILALNASVEAARAGQQGRGFAVVAAEVRALAERSAAAAHEIKALIENTCACVHDGTSIVRETGRTIEGVVGSIEEVSKTVAQISGATDRQASGVVNINNAVVELEGVTQQNAALVEQSSAAASMLGEQVARLSEAIDVFRFRHDPIHRGR